MSLSEILVGVLLGIGVLSFALTSLGQIFSRDLYDQIHYLAPASIVGSIAIVAAVLVHEGLSQSGAKAILIAILLLVSNPVLSHATARAGRVRRNQQVWPKPDEELRMGRKPE